MFSSLSRTPKLREMLKEDKAFWRGEKSLFVGACKKKKSKRSRARPGCACSYLRLLQNLGNFQVLPFSSLPAIIVWKSLGASGNISVGL
jgi:hypothetical protein